MINIYKKSTMKKLIKIFGKDYVFQFPMSKVVGLSYNYEDRKLKTVFENIPFNETQQLYITPTQFVKIIVNLSSLGLRTHVETNIEIPEEDKSSLNRLIHNLRRDATLGIKSNDKIINDINIKLEELKEEYGASISSISYFNGKDHISLKANGILFTDQNSIELTDKILTFRGI
ncbi:hypothetical protein ACWGPZ_26770 [Priestia megaterium]